MKRATPGAMMLMAKPETMWLTPNVTVARACSRPPRMPPMTPPTIAIHGPHSQPHQPAKTVPMIIMPSRPMFTVPLRSAKRPARPARAIGAAVRTITPNVPGDVRLLLSLMTRDAETTRMPASDADPHRSDASTGSPGRRARCHGRRGHQRRRSCRTRLRAASDRAPAPACVRGAASDGLRGRGTQ